MESTSNAEAFRPFIVVFRGTNRVVTPRLGPACTNLTTFEDLLDELSTTFNMGYLKDASFFVGDELTAFGHSIF
jgi:hypothetical protein